MNEPEPCLVNLVTEKMLLDAEIGFLEEIIPFSGCETLRIWLLGRAASRSVRLPFFAGDAMEVDSSTSSIEKEDASPSGDVERSLEPDLLKCTIKDPEGEGVRLLTDSTLRKGEEEQDVSGPRR